MYSLFEIRKILSISNPGGGAGVEILLSAYSRKKDFSILALVCNNGYILLRYSNLHLDTPVVRHLCWYNNPEKQIKALCFDSSGLWLLTVTQDATIYILPISSVLGMNSEPLAGLKIESLTEIKLSGQRANMTSIQWWKTQEGEHIAIVGSELGEISFINLLNKKEVGGTYITSGILALNILHDENHDTTYLLITGNKQQQWRLLLEEKRSNYYWPFNSDDDITYNSGKSVPISEAIALSDEKNGDQRLQRLSKFDSGTFLTRQSGGERNLVSAYNSSSCLLQVLEGDLDQMHLFSYKVPANCKSIIMSDKFIFVVLKNQNNSDQHVLKIISRKLSEISSENTKKKEPQNAEFQQFCFDDEILAIYKLPANYAKLKTEVSDFDKSIFQRLNLITYENENPEGCILVQTNCVWECRQRIPAESLFLNITNFPSELPLAGH